MNRHLPLWPLWLLLALASGQLGAQEKSVNPGINKSFQDPDVPEYVGRFEREGRDAFDHRFEVLRACRLEPGMTVADIGAGTGLFTRLFAQRVGPRGAVYAVDIAEEFVRHVEESASQEGLQNVRGVVCAPDSVQLPPDSVDLAFLCDTYHHFEFPHKTMASLHRSLRPGGQLILLDYHRLPGISSDWLLGHIRAGKEVFVREIEQAGFRQVEELKGVLDESYLVRFEKTPAPVFRSIFDGRSLDGWDGDPKHWRVEQGRLVGEVTADTLLKQNSWLVWRGGTVADFQLKLEYRISSGGNSGIGYRCAELQGRPFALRGPQADMEGGRRWTGINYEEQGRAFLALRGQRTVVRPGRRPQLLEQFADPAELQKIVRQEDWNQCHLIVRGGRMRHLVNGTLMSDVTDRDLQNGRRRGLLGVQVHVGPPMKVEFRNIRLAALPAEPSGAVASPQSPPANQLSPAQQAALLSFDNPSALRHLQDARLRLTAPPPKGPVDGQKQIQIRSPMYRVAHGALPAGARQPSDKLAQGQDVVLLEGERSLRVPLPPLKVLELHERRPYQWELSWDLQSGGYRVDQVRQDDLVVYQRK